MKRRGSGKIKAGLILTAALLALLVVISCGSDSNVFLPPQATTDTPEIFKSSVPGTPVRITKAGGSTLAYTDYEQGAVVFINSVTLEESGRFSVAGTPLGIAVVSNTVFVGIPERVEFGKTKGGNVTAFDRKGKYLYTLGSNSGYGLTKNPTDIAVGGGRIFVLDPSIKRVKDYDLSAPLVEPTVSWMIPIFGSGIINATAIALDPTGTYLSVSSYGGFGSGGAHGWGDNPPEIRVYEASGFYAEVPGAFINGGAQPGYEFSTPQGLAIDSAGNRYVPDIMGGRVLIYNSAGIGIGTIGSHGTAPGQFLSPLDVLLDEASGDIFVTNSRNRRIEVFRGGMQ